MSQKRIFYTVNIERLKLRGDNNGTLFYKYFS